MKLNYKLNSVMSVLEIVMTAGTVFLLYKFILMNLDVAYLGVWSAVLATTSLSKFGDIGTAAGLSKYVAEAFVSDDREKSLNYISTALLSNLALYGLISVVLYAPVYYGLHYVVGDKMVGVARSLLPFAFGSFVCLNLVTVIFSGLIGLHKTYIKSIAALAGTLVQVVVAATFVSKFGLVAVAVAQGAQYVVSIGLGIYFIAKALAPGRLWLPLRFDKAIFRELIGFGAKLQVSNLVNMIFEPAIKFVVSAVAGVTALGYFEIGYRYAFQIRNVVAAPTAILIPAFASNAVLHPERNRALYDKAISLATVYGGAIMLAGAAAMPVVSYILLGRVEPLAVFFGAAMCVAWYINIVTNMAYFLGVAFGRIGGNLIGNAVTSFAGPALGFLFGYAGGAVWIGGIGAAAIAAGAAVTMWINCRKFGYHLFPGPAVMWGEARSVLHLPVQMLLRRKE